MAGEGGTKTETSVVLLAGPLLRRWGRGSLVGTGASAGQGYTQQSSRAEDVLALPWPWPQLAGGGQVGEAASSCSCGFRFMSDVRRGTH